MPQLLAGLPPPGGRAEDSLPSGGAGCSLSIPTQEPACYGLPLSNMNLRALDMHALWTVAVVCPILTIPSNPRGLWPQNLL